MGWIPRPRSGGGSDVARVAAEVAEHNPNPQVVLFRLDEQLDPQSLRVWLASALAGVGISAGITVTGPDRVRAVLQGQLPREAVLVVLATSNDEAHDRLMDLVQWLIANDRRQLAERLVFVPVGSGSRAPRSFPFAHVPLASLNADGAPRAWRAASGGHERLLRAVLDQARGEA